MSLIARFSFPSNPVLYTNVPEEPHCAVPRCYGQSSIRALARLRIAAEKAGKRAAIFWMFVRDEAPDRAYVQLMKSYKADPASLMRELPHRDEATLNTVAQNLTVILWRDFAELVCGPGRDAESTAVKSILAQRTSFAGFMYRELIPQDLRLAVFVLLFNDRRWQVIYGKRVRRSNRYDPGKDLPDPRK